MKIAGFYVDSENLYIKTGEIVSFYIEIEENKVTLPSSVNKDNQMHQIKLADLLNIVQKEGCFPLGMVSSGEYKTLRLEHFLKSRVSGRYFQTIDAMKKLYITTKGDLCFAYMTEKDLYFSSQSTSTILAQTVECRAIDSATYIGLTFIDSIRDSVKGVSVVDFNTQKRYVVPHFFAEGVLNVDLTKASQVAQYQIVIDSMIEGRTESQLVRIVNSEGIDVEGDVAFWPFAMENESLVFYSARQEVDQERKEIAIKSIVDVSGNSIELEVNLDDMGFTGVWTRCKRLNRNIELSHQYSDGKLKINFSNFDGYTSGNFWINVNTRSGWYQLYYHPPIMFSESNRHFFVRGTENSARYAFFSEEGLLRYAIKPVSNYQKSSDKTLLFNNLCFLNNAFQIELCDYVPIQEVILGEGETLEFYQNGKVLYICLPNQKIITVTEYISVLSKGQSFELEATSFLSDASAQSKLVLFTCWRERLAMKSLDIEYYVTTKKVSKKIKVETPNIRARNLELIVNDDTKIRKIIAISRRDLSIKELEFDFRERVLVIRTRGFEPFIIDTVTNYVIDIVFVTDNDWVMPLVNNHKQLAENEKKQPWQISENNCEMLYQIYINTSGNLSVRVKDNYYAENWEKISVKNNLILYESHAGKMIADSGYVIFKYLVDNPQFKEFEHIWVVDDEQSQAPEALEEKYRNACEFVVKNTRAYRKALLEAKYLIIAVTLPFYFAKKPDQIYIHTWHAITVKSIGYDVVGAPWISWNVVRNFMMSDYIISPNDYMTNVIVDSCKLQGVYRGTILEGGYPRNDLFLSTEKSTIIKKLHHFSVEYDPKKPTILYAPTWRGDENIVNPTNQVPELKELMIKLKKDYSVAYNVFLKPHPLVYKYALQDSELQSFLVPNSIDPNELLTIVDILIADFSSIFIDYLMTDNQVIFYFPDKADYIQERGIYLDFNDLPGPQVENYQQLQKELNRIIAGKKSKYLKKYAAMKSKYLPYEDGKTAGRYVEQIFRNKPSDKVKEISVYDSNKKKLLMYIGSMLDNGITSSAINLLNLLDYDKYDVTIMMYIHKTKESLNNMEKINKKARILFVSGAPLYTSEEIVKDEMLFRTDLSNADWQGVVGMYRRDMSYRLFPNMYFDVAIEFNAYGAAAVKNILSLKVRQRLIYLHNEISKDSRRIENGKFIQADNFNLIFKLYSYADKLVSVSETLMKENFKALSHVMNKEQLAFARNVINYDYILEQSQREVDIGNLKSIYGDPIAPIDTSTGLNFVTSGRLSMEKNHISLIKAFIKFKDDYPKARLFILGKGPLQEEIAKVTKDAKMLGQIVMLGHLDNPFSLISKMDYFVLPSLYEGQSMVLLEALVLRKKIMASNIKPNIDVLGYNTYGLLTKGKTPEALFEGLREIVNHSDFEQFDYVSYNQNALEDFYRLINEK